MIALVERGMNRIGTLKPCRYPVKSMAGEELEQAFVGFAGWWATGPTPSSACPGPRASPGTPGASRRT